MALADGWNSQLYLGGYEVTQWVKTGDVERSMDANERTAWGNNGNRSYRPGLVTGKMSVERFDDEGDAVGVDGVAEIVRSFIRAAGGFVATLVNDTPVVGGACEMFNAHLASDKRGAPVDGIRTGTTELQAEALEDGVLLKTLGAETASTTGTSVDNGAATTGGWVVHQHVTAKAGTTPSLTTVIEHSTDNTTFATLTTLAATDVVGAERKSGTGTVNRYRRRKSTITGTAPSFTHVVALATY
jgi:hypothetical protein